MTLIIGSGLSDAELAENARHLQAFSDWWTALMRDHPDLATRYEQATRDLYEKKFKRGVDAV